MFGIRRLDPDGEISSQNTFLRPGFGVCPHAAHVLGEIRGDPLEPKLQILNFGFKLPDLRSQVSGLGVWDSGPGFRSPGFGFRVPGFEFQVSGFGFRVSGFRYGLRVCRVTAALEST